MIRLVGGTFYKEQDTKRRLLKFIASAKQLSFGSECLAFEKKFASWQGSKDAVFFNSGSSANLALIQALLNLGRLQKGDKVAFSAVTWSTNVMPLMSSGLIPIPMDVSLDTLNVTSEEVARVIKAKKVKAVFITNLLGFSHDLENIRALCKKEKVLLLEDNCESLGSRHAGKKLGNFGVASTFSFFVGHHLSTIEGGMVCTGDKELAEALRMVRAHGWDRHLSKETQKRLRKKHGIDPFYSIYAFYDIGYNFRPSEINGFIGSLQIAHADEIVARREKTFATFAKALHGRPDAYLPFQSAHMDTLSAFAFPVLCTSRKVKDALIAACAGKIEIRPIVGGSMPHQPFFKKYYPNAHTSLSLKNATRIHELGLYLPIHPDMTAQDKKVIVDALSSV
jgi:CDP-6-deoxy-D-xylo-4-hexulose-3-dehydrase